MNKQTKSVLESIEQEKKMLRFVEWCNDNMWDQVFDGIWSQILNPEVSKTTKELLDMFNQENK
jgi:hypothetical protein